VSILTHRRIVLERSTQHAGLMLVRVYRKTWPADTAKSRPSFQMNRVCGAAVWPVGIVNNSQLLLWTLKVRIAVIYCLEPLKILL
jgi:hypothetical protein